MDQVKQMIKACIVSRKGGVPLTEIDNDYRQLVGTNIPHAKYGFLSLEDFIQSIAEVMMVHNPDGSVILKARDNKTSHIASLVEGQKTIGNARKKVTNRFRMSSSGNSYTHAASSNWHYEKNRGNNNMKLGRIAPGSATQGGYNVARHRVQEMGQLHTLHAESSFKHLTEKELTRKFETHAERYSFNSAYKENEVHHCQTNHALKMTGHHFQRRNSPDKIHVLDEPCDEFNKSQVKVKNHRRISVDDTILVTIVNNYYRSPAGHSCQRRSPLSEWSTGDEEREVQQDQLCRRSKHQRYLKDISTVEQKYRMKPSRLGEPEDFYEEAYVQKKWTGESVNDFVENISEDYIREDGDYTHYKRKVSRQMPGLLIKVKNEYAADRRI